MCKPVSISDRVKVRSDTLFKDVKGFDVLMTNIKNLDDAVAQKNSHAYSICRDLKDTKFNNAVLVLDELGIRANHVAVLHKICLNDTWKMAAVLQAVCDGAVAEAIMAHAVRHGGEGINVDVIVV